MSKISKILFFKFQDSFYCFSFSKREREREREAETETETEIERGTDLNRYITNKIYTQKINLV